MARKVKCSYCGNSYATTLTSCPFCGGTYKKEKVTIEQQKNYIEKKKKNEKIANIIFVIIFLIILGLITYISYAILSTAQF